MSYKQYHTGRFKNFGRKFLYFDQTEWKTWIKKKNTF